METLYDIFPVILFVLATILLIVLIILSIKMIITLKKVDQVVDNVNTKVGKLDAAFSLVDSITDGLSMINDKIVSFIANGIRNFFKRKNRKEEVKDEK